MMNERTRFSRAALAGLVLWMLALSGCQDPVGRIPVRGRITYGGGPWPAEGTVYFKPVAPAEGHPRLTGIGHFSPAGAFRVQSTGDGQGLVPGRYALTVECWETPPNMEGRPVKSYVPRDYQPSEVTVDEKLRSLELTLDVPKPRT